MEAVEFGMVVRLIDRHFHHEWNALRVGGKRGFQRRAQLLG